MNASTLNNSRDMGKDGAATGYLTSNNTVHGYFAKDVTAYTLGYYDQDYKASGSSTMEATYTGPTAFGDGATNLYNGNIRHLVTAIQGMTTLGHTYRYDQLQRLKSVNTFYLTGTGLTNNTWSGMTATPEYNSSYTYDPNGNLLTLNRNAYGAQLTEMDKLIYQYDTNPITGKRWNRLRNAKETGNSYMTGSTPSYDDIRGGNNYFFYDKLGQLTKDSLNGIASVRWRLGDKKALVINHVAANAPQVKFIYDPFGRRVAKIVTPKSNKILQANRQFTYYALDANGQEMAVYTANINTSSPTQNTATLDEHYLYGASRLGVRDAAKAMYNNGPVNYAASSYYKNTLGKRNYELTNYLGNVQAVITDRRTYSAGSYLATLVMSSDYYAFGMAMPGRTFNSASYRYGYNGMEKDDEVKSGGNSYTTEFRQYDPRVGRWLSLDPLMGMFPHMSPYVAFDNNPIYFTDPTGLATEDYVKLKSGKIVYNSTVNSQEEATAVYGPEATWIDPGSPEATYESSKGTVVLGEGGNFTVAGIPKHAHDDASYLHIDNDYAEQKAEAATNHRKTMANSDALTNLAVVMITAPLAVMAAEVVLPALSSALPSAPSINLPAAFSVFKDGGALSFSLEGAISYEGVAAVTTASAATITLGVAVVQQQMNSGNDDGYAYERTDPDTGEGYIGQAKDDKNYLSRQKSHDDKLNKEHSYEVKGRAKAGEALDKLEEDLIRKGGGPSRKGGKLANKRYQMNEKRYRAAGGTIDKPTK